jgi:membrane protein DedA with SNARE-associated domain
MRQRFLGRSLLAQRLSPDRQARIEQLIRQYDILALAVAAIMPPPFPFKPFIICAGLLEFHQGRLFVGLFIGRALRYGTLAYLSMRYGNEALGMLQQHTGWFFLGIGVIVAVLGVYFLVRWYVFRRPAVAATRLSPDMQP